MIKSLVFAVLLSVACNISFAQDRKAIDSVKRELSTSVQDTSRVIAMNYLAGKYWTYKKDSAFFFAQGSLELARKIKYPKGESNALCTLGLINSTSGDFAKSLELFLKALRVAEQNGINGYEKAHAMYNIGQYYSAAGDDSVGINYMRQAKHIFDSLHIGMMIQLTRTSLGEAYLKMNRLDSATKYGQMAYDDMIRDDTPYMVEATTYILNSLAFIHAKKGEMKLALEYFRKSLTFSMESPPRRSQTYHGIAKTYQQLNEPDSAIFYAKRSLEESQKGAYYQNIIDAGSLLSDLYEQKDSRLAFEYSKIASAAKDSLAITADRNAYKNLTGFDEKERQYEIETATAFYQNKVKLYSLIAGLSVFLVIAFILYWNSRKQKKANSILQKQKQEIERQKKNVEETLNQLKSTQSQLIQSEKMASLGELTAGVAHEIQNPLNFVNNFSEVNKELIDEAYLANVAGNTNEVKELLSNLKDNEEKISHHGKRADAIVKGMLLHSQTSTGQKEPTDINKLADEYLRLSYHGLRAKDNTFNATIKTDFDDKIGNINVIPQDIGRVLLNLYNNAFYALSAEALAKADGSYNPTVTVSTKKNGDKVEIRVADNGNGIPPKVIDKIFQPFFTTKPTGQGTGLGLSLAYDIVKAHGGEISAESNENAGTQFIVRLPV